MSVFKTFFLTAITCLTVFHPITAGSRSVKFLNNCPNSVIIHYDALAVGRTPFVETEGLVSPTSDGTVSAYGSVSYNVPDDATNVQFWFESTKIAGSSKYLPPCPNPGGCQRMQGTRASFTFPFLNASNTDTVTTYQVMADAGPCPFTYSMTINSSTPDYFCYMSYYALGKANAASTQCPTSPNGDGTLGQSPFICPNQYSYQVELCSTVRPSQVQPALADHSDPLPTPPVRNSTTQSRFLRYINNCQEDIWIQVGKNKDAAKPLDVNLVHLGIGQSYEFGIPNSGWAGRFFTKGQCFRDGQSCRIGQSLPPCGVLGCTPPSSVYTEFFFPDINDQILKENYDISAVDGFDKFSAIIKPVNTTYENGKTASDFSCYETGFGLNPERDCPTEPDFFQDGTFRSVNLLSKNKAQCIAPCKMATGAVGDKYFDGLGLTETMEPAFDYCCPGTLFPGTNIINPDPTLTKNSTECRKGKIIHTQYYLKLKASPYKSAYSYCYDDDNALFYCPPKNSFEVTICPPDAAFKNLRYPNGQPVIV